MKALPPNVRRRMAALQAMAADTSSEREAMLAARRLHALLAEYGMSEFEVEDDSAEIGKDSYTIDHEQLGAYATRIAMGIAELYFCKVYIHSTVGKGKNRTRRIFVTGSSNYRASAMIMIKSITNAVISESKIAKRPCGVDGWSFICSFRNAAGIRIWQRCQDLIKQARAGQLLNEETGRNLPVLANMYDRAFNEIDAFNSHLGLRKSAQHSAASDLAGRMAGRAFGDKVGLREGLSNQVSRRLLS